MRTAKGLKYNGSQPNSHIADATVSVHICHLGNIAHRTGRVINGDPNNGHIVGDREAMNLWRRDYEPGWEPVV